MIVTNDNLYSAAKKFAHVYYRGMDWQDRSSSTVKFKARCREHGFEYIGHRKFMINDADKMLLFVLKWS